MGPSKIDELLEIAVSQLRSIFNVQRVILFGSRARGDADSRSDIDLAIDGPDLTATEWQQIETVLENMPTLLKIEKVKFQDISPAFQQRILQEGIVLYDATSFSQSAG